MNTESLPYSPSQGEAKTVREGSPLLTESQSFAAQTAYSALLFKKFFFTARHELPWLTQKDPSISKEQYMFGMLDAYDVVTARNAVTTAVANNESSDTLFSLRQDAAARQKQLETNRGDLGDYYLSHTTHIIEGLKEEKEALWEEASQWGIREEDASLKRSHKELATIFGKKKHSFIKTVGANALSDLAPLAAGFTAESLLHLGESVPQAAKPLVLTGVLATQVLLWKALFWDNGKENLKSLGETGVSTVVLSKALYSLAQKSANEKFQKFMGTAGYIGQHGLVETPYFFALASLIADDLRGGTMLLVANASSYVINRAKLKGSQLHRHYVSREDERAIPSQVTEIIGRREFATQPQQLQEEQQTHGVVIDLTEFDDTLEMRLPPQPNEINNFLFCRRISSPSIDGSTALDS